MTPPDRTTFAARALVGLATLLAAADAAPAQSVRWRTDYNAARKEAAETGRPILIDLVTENCMWCKRLEASTFRDPTILAALNDQFIPLKLDAERDPTLAQALRVQSYPTMVIAAPDGKILALLEGYMEAPRLNEYLQRAVVTAQTPDWMPRDFQEASKAVAAANYPRAVSLLKGIVEDGKERPVQAKARQVLRELEQQAAGRLAHARQMEDQGQSLEAADSLTELLRNYPGTQAAAEASSRMTALAAKPDVRDRQRSRRARELLAQAREEFRTQQFYACLERCDVLTGTFDDLPEGGEAKQLAAEIKANPEWLARACDGMQDRLGAMYLAQADAWKAKGDHRQALACLEKVTQTCPGSAQAQAALVKLNQLKGQPTQQAEFKKP
jgi:tetratricopeptide (TPR) repeat protein